jgi:hypothetical protein
MVAIGVTVYQFSERLHGPLLRSPADEAQLRSDGDAIAGG